LGLLVWLLQDIWALKQENTSFFKHPFVLYGNYMAEKKDEYGRNAANNLGFIVLKSVGST
jgi:hypothetical protein